MVATTGKGGVKGSSLTSQQTAAALSTLYFQSTTDTGKRSSSGSLVYRVSTTNSGSSDPVSIQLMGNNSAQDVALALMQSLYESKNDNALLGAITNTPGAVQLTAYRRTDPLYRVIIDILKVPVGITFATGNVRMPLNIFDGNAKSVIVDTTYMGGVGTSIKVAPPGSIGISDGAMRVDPRASNTNIQRTLDMYNSIFTRR
jgi:hypothetical protein